MKMIDRSCDAFTGRFWFDESEELGNEMGGALQDKNWIGDLS